MPFRFWLCVDGPELARVFTAVMQVGRVQLRYVPACRGGGVEEPVPENPEPD